LINAITNPLLERMSRVLDEIRGGEEVSKLVEVIFERRQVILTEKLTVIETEVRTSGASVAGMVTQLRNRQESDASRFDKALSSLGTGLEAVLQEVSVSNTRSSEQFHEITRTLGNLANRLAKIEVSVSPAPNPVEIAMRDGQARQQAQNRQQIDRLRKVVSELDRRIQDLKSPHEYPPDVSTRQLVRQLEDERSSALERIRALEWQY
jgi:hypothetical protein